MCPARLKDLQIIVHIRILYRTMNDTAHIFNPKDDSLDERVRAYRSCSSTLRNTKASLELVNDSAWSDRLGSREEIEQAHMIAKHSIEMAVNQLSQSEAERAVGQGLLDNQELKEIVQTKRLQNIQNQRANQNSQQQANKRTQK